MSEKENFDELIASNNIQILNKDDENFPESLKNLPKKRTPKEIYVQGEMVDFTKCVAIVGTRKCSQEGQELAHEIATRLVIEGYTIVSGLAKGIDISAHAGAIECDGKTIAVLAGLPKIYPPQHEKHAQKITNFGCLISENFPNGDNLTLALVKRNEIIAALSDAVIVVESSEKGGAHYALDYARKLERLTIAMEPRVEDEELVKGFKRFCSQGVKPAKTAEDVIAILNSYKKPSKTNLDDYT
ncbi:MAG: hypothetical protein CL763_10435 [Chloroflexi bacterium]|nr:hypothetical protein [Chloroflexota bacterium]